MPGLSIHVVDVSRGIVATGMAVTVALLEATRAPREIARGTIDAQGSLAVPALGRRLERGTYEAAFAVADYYRTGGVLLPDQPFLDVVTYRFGIDDAEQHYHLPFKCTPWGYSCFRGGA